MYRLDVLIQGYPGKSLCHGGLGWSTIALLRGEGRTILIDVGAFAVRPEFARQLQAAACAPESVTDVVLTHAHWDHAVNYTLFPKARIWIGRVEMDWARSVPAGFNPLPELYVRDLAQHPRLHLLEDGEAFLPGLTAHLCPGHTPGCLVYRLTGNEVPVVFSGDAAKNRAEMLSMATDMTMDAAASHASLERIWGLWRQAPGTLLIPGHDLAMRLDAAGRPDYLGERRAGIAAWFSEDLAVTQEIDLATPRF
ncbi:MBL fold metallo-hydrolase [Roseicella sp. DB1501]|uniref:MBL fold metallo-hydrolase n=1 Tax=Roseicella sp. DB1501 TaxID=2730925 RepID=UPI0014924FAC|nr:MBL fold metallo-hydrolase [Roseicella sp. DB1501]NOG70688.1 MBL fold metallo-hydrolase [Roseicella sp. DB1501]